MSDDVGAPQSQVLPIERRDARLSPLPLPPSADTERVWRQVARAIRKSGFLSLAGGRLVAAVLSGVWLVVAARALPLSQFGDLALLLALGSIFSVIADLGLPLVVMQTAAQRPDAAFSAVFLAARRRLPVGVAAAVVVGVTFVTTARGPSTVIPAIFAVSILATTVSTSVTAGLRGVGQPRVEAINEVASRFLVLVVGGYWVRRGGGVLAAVATYSAADVLSALALTMVAWRRLERSGEAPVAAFSLRANAPLAMAGLLGTVYYRVDVWLLAAMSGPGAVALYTAAYRLLDGVLVPASALSALVVPITARLEQRPRLMLLDRMTRGAVCMVAILSALGIAVAAPVLAATFGSNYREAAGMLRVLLLGIVPGVAVLMMAPAAALADRRSFAGIVAVALTVNVTANIALIPMYGGTGAAWATLISQTVLAGHLRWSLGRSAEPNRP